MAQQDKLGDRQEATQPDEAAQLKRSARRRLIGAAALALFAVIVLPMVMDHQPAPALKDIQVRIPSPDEGAPQKVVSAPKPAPRADIKPIAKPEIKADSKPESKPESKSESKQEPRSEAGAEAKVESKPAIKPEPKAEPKPESKSDAKSDTKPDSRPEVPKGSGDGGDAWVVQLGAYQDPGRVKNLLAKLKDMGVPAYTEKVDTANGPRTRVRAGPFASQEAAEKARGRARIVGVDGPVVKKP